MATKEKNFWILLVFLLSGLVIGRIAWGTGEKNRFSMVVILWTGIWTYRSCVIRFKCFKNYICIYG